MSTFETFLSVDLLNEAYMASGRTSAIMPAGRILFNKNKVTPNHALSKEAGVWGDGDQHVRTYKVIGEEKHFHVSSGGHYNPKKDSPIGHKEHFHHDQTQRQLPGGHLVGVSNYKDGKKVSHHGEDHSATNAPFHVYK